MNELLAQLLVQLTRIADSLEIMAMMQIPPEEEEPDTPKPRKGRIVANIKE